MNPIDGLLMKSRYLWSDTLKNLLLSISTISCHIFKKFLYESFAYFFFSPFSNDVCLPFWWCHYFVDFIFYHTLNVLSIDESSFANFIYIAIEKPLFCIVWLLHFYFFTFWNCKTVNHFGSKTWISFFFCFCCASMSSDVSIGSILFVLYLFFFFFRLFSLYFLYTFIYIYIYIYFGNTRRGEREKKI